MHHVEEEYLYIYIYIKYQFITSPVRRDDKSLKDDFVYPQKYGREISGTNGFHVVIHVESSEGTRRVRY